VANLQSKNAKSWPQVFLALTPSAKWVLNGIFILIMLSYLGFTYHIMVANGWCTSVSHITIPCEKFQCFDWLRHPSKLQPITFTSNLLVSTRYHPWLSLPQWFHKLSLFGWTFHIHFTWMKCRHFNSHKTWLCLVTNFHSLVYLIHSPN